MPSLKITLGTGETHEVAFTAASTVTVITKQFVDGQLVDKHYSYSDVASVAYSDDDPRDAVLAVPGGEQPNVGLVDARFLGQGATVDQSGNTIPPHPHDLVPAAAAEEQTGEQPSTETPETPEPTEAARELAEEHHVRLSNVTGTGAQGRVTVEDVKGYLAERGRL